MSRLITLEVSSGSALCFEAEMELKTEKRKFKRFAVINHAFVAFRPEFKKLGRITDISREGLGCEYVVHNGIEEATQEAEIDIFSSGNQFYLPGLFCEVVYDILLVNQEFGSSDLVENRRCGLKLGELTEEQAEKLVFFLNSHVIGKT